MAGEQIIPLPAPLQDLSVFIDTQPERLAHESSDLQELALRAAKYVFDWAVQTESASWPHVECLLNNLTDVEPPQTRSAAKRKSSHTLPDEPRKKKNKVFPLETPIPSLFVDRMSMEQIWEQLDLRGARVCEHLQILEGEGEDEGENEDERSEFDEEESEEEEEVSELEESGDDQEEGDSSLPGEEDVATLQEESSEEEEDEEGDRPSSMFDVIRKKPTTSKASTHSELDDGFFNLHEFNAEIEQAEAKSVSKGQLHRDTDSEDSGTETDVDLFEAVDEAVDEEDLEENYFYRDFFDAPRSSKSRQTTSTSKPSKVRFHDQVKVKKIKARGRGLPVSAMMYEEDDEDDEEFVAEDDDGSDQETYKELSDDDEEEDEDEDEDEEEGEGDDDDDDDDEAGEDAVTEDGTRLAIERMRDDLFAEDEEQQKDLGMTTHERRMAALQEQIKKLEAENVAKKDWVLMGEASSKSRPRDSLLQEDLEFDRIAKSVPIVTEEVVAGLEERIKTRIKEGRFDDVVRRRPLDDKPFLPSRLFELQDTKSQQSLAQIYENEYMAAQAGSSTDDRDAKLKKEHEAITKLWEGICNKLDALCNAHYVPKQVRDTVENSLPKATITTVSDVAAATLESALPTNKSVSTTLAPEEIFAPASSDPRVRSELTPAEKRALRTKQRKARKKERDLLEKSVDKFAKKKKGVKEQKDAALKSLVKSGKGVTVVGKEAKRAKTAGKRKS
ncbi:U3 small nucleolar ribonucleoprotein complex, subunit Mpp10 [Pisolithus sp. B1]|nr:U3 small nucleolar ribonucleoprotein complex, subunit Mpp10 [Pisolithus sp. B1]